MGNWTNTSVVHGIVLQREEAMMTTALTSTTICPRAHPPGSVSDSGQLKSVNLIISFHSMPSGFMNLFVSTLSNMVLSRPWRGLQGA